MSHSHATLSARYDAISFFFDVYCKQNRNNFVFPTLKAPSLRFIQHVGREKLTKIVLHHYGLLRHIASLNFYANEYQPFMEEVTKISHFMLEALGCNDSYSKEYGLNDSMTQPFTITSKGRDVWLTMFLQTLKEMQFPEKYLQEFWTWIELFSLRLLDTSVLETLPKRYTFDTIKASLHS